jgi:hypothetical protein
LKRCVNIGLFRANNGDFGGKKSNIETVHSPTSPLIFAPEVSYMACFIPKNDDIGAENSYFWKSNQNISIC